MPTTLLSSTILQPGINVLTPVSGVTRYLVLHFKGETVANSAYRGDMLLCNLLPLEPLLPDCVVVSFRQTVFYGTIYIDAWLKDQPDSVQFWVPPSSNAPGRTLETYYFS